MQHHVTWLKHLASCIFDHRQVHQILEAVLSVIFVTIFVYFDYRTIDYESSIVCKRLQTLFVVTVAILRFQILVKAALLVLPCLLPFIHFVDVFKISYAIIFAITVILKVTKHL